jgi:cbb3-type cytochrome oxidase subunit 3
MKKILVISFFIASFFLTNFVLAGGKGDWGLNSVVSDTSKEAFNVKEVNDDSGFYLSSRVGVIIGAILSFVAVIFMILIIYAGILWMIARGNEQQVDRAKNLIIQAIIGLIIVLSAYIITSFIGDMFTGESPIVADE